MPVKLWSIGLDFRSADMDLRGRFASGVHPLVQDGRSDILESVAIATCNRVEVFGVGEVQPEDLLTRWIQITQSPEQIRSQFSILKNEVCLRHLFRVTSSLESMVVGETQITSQVKRAYEEAAHAGHIGVYLHRSFQRAFKVAKRIRSQTEVGRLAVSIPSVGVKLAEKVLGDLKHCRIGILGLGEIGRVAAEHFSTVRPQKLFLYNRTQKTAETLAESLKANECEVAVAGEVGELVRSCDILVNAVDADLLSTSELERWKERSETSLILDLAVPPRIPLYDLANHYVYRVDDLRLIAEENSRLRSQEVEKAEQIIAEEAESCWRSLQSMKVGQILGQVQARADDLAAKEIRALKLRLAHLKAEDWEEIEKMARRLSSKVLQDPMVGLRSSLQETQETENLMQFFRSIFRI